MPVFFQKDIDEYTKFAIWHINEDEPFFMAQVPLQREIIHPHKRLQHLAGRYLLKYLFPDFPIELIEIADTRKPFLQNESYHFSISHCGNYAAVIVSKTQRVGVDIEIPSQKIENIKKKFLTVRELQLASGEWLTGSGENCKLQAVNCKLAGLWSCKEAVFKWYGLGEVDFKKHIKIESTRQIAEDVFETKIVFKKNEEIFLVLHSLFFNELCLSYVVT